MKKSRYILLVALILGLLLAGRQPVYAQENESQYFPETGHWVSGDFLEYYRSAADPLLLFGFPITDEFVDPLTGLTVQYFQKTRFEKSTNDPAFAAVQLSKLGELLYQPGPIVAVPNESTACQFFPQTGHSTCYAFLDFYNSQGAVNQFGYPISEIELQDNQYVQYFQTARLEWHPELPAGQRVILADLGRMYFDQLVGDPTLLAPNLNNFILQPILALNGRAFVARAVMPANSIQTIYVIAQDQYLRPVSAVIPTIQVSLPGGTYENYVLPPTDQDGVSEFHFPIGNIPPGEMIHVAVALSYNDLVTNIDTWFRIWW